MNYLPIPAALVQDRRLPLRLRLWLRHAGRCHWGGRIMPHWRKRWHPASVTCDHVIPRSMGGTDDMANLVASCSRCNTLRGDIEAGTFRAFVDRRQGELPEPGGPGWTDTVRSLALFAAWRG